MPVLDEDIQRVIAQQRLGYVASVCSDGTANLSPKGTMAVWDERHLVFAHIHSHQTVANIEAGHTVVEVNVVDPIGRKGYRFKGPAQVHREGELFRAGADFFQRRSGLDEHRIQAIVIIRVDRAAPLVSPSYDDGSTEQEIEQRFLALYGLRRDEAQGPAVLSASHVIEPVDDRLELLSGGLDHARARAFVEDWLAAWNAHDLDALLTHFADGVIFTSPVAARTINGSNGVLRGKAALREYWEKGLPLIPDLHFELVDFYVGVDTIVINYRNQNGGLVSEVLRFVGQLVVEGHGTYQLTGPGPGA